MNRLSVEKRAVLLGMLVEGNSLRTTSRLAYSTTNGKYPHVIGDLGPATTPTSTAADLVDSVLATGVKSGYTLTYTAGASDLSYSISAVPTTAGVTGQRGFWTDQTGVIRANVSGAATSGSTPIS